jgi:energy-coupling factor transport system substrate-specific component
MSATPHGPGPARGDRPSALLPLAPAQVPTLALAAVLGLLAFTWPLLPGLGPAAAPSASPAGLLGGAPGAAGTTLLFAAVLVVVLAVVVAEVAGGTLDARAVAVLGVLTAVGAALRPLGTGIAGFEPVFFLLVLAGRAFGPGFGLVLGATTLFASALTTGGVGPWLPYQMLGAAGVGAGAGLLPGWRGRTEAALIAGYALVAGLAYGLLLNLSFWPYVVTGPSAIAFVPGAAVVDNLRRFVAFTAATSLGFDVPRAIVTAVLVTLTGRRVLVTLRRAARRATMTPA